MVCQDHSPVGRSPIEELAPGARGLIREEVKNWMPIGMLQVDRVEHGISDVQQLLFA